MPVTVLWGRPAVYLTEERRELVERLFADCAWPDIGGVELAGKLG